MSAEFDQYATEYSHLLNDPLRDRFTSDPVFFHRRKWMLIRDFFAQRNVNPSNLRWLDVGSGQGELLRLAGGSFAQAVGCDPSSKMIQSCPGEEVYEQPSPAEFPFPDRSFDFITAVCVYHHVHGGDRALLTKSIQRVLKPGGLFCMIEHNPWNPVTRTIVGRCAVDVDAELLAASNASQLLNAGGFELLRTIYFLYLPEKLFGHFGAMERPLERAPLGGQYALLGQAPV